MNFTYENQGSSTFMVYEVGAEEIIDSMSLGMITNNKILGLAPTIFFQQDTTKYFKYNISAKVSADQFLMGVVNKKRLIGVFQGIVNAMISAEEYMLDVNSICLDLKYIFTDVSTCETTLVCIPIMDLEKPPVDLKLFFKNIVFGTQFDQTENCDYLAKLFNYLNGAAVFSLTEFKELLDEIERGGTVVPQSVVQDTPVKQPIPKTQPASVVSKMPVESEQPVKTERTPIVIPEQKKVEVPSTGNVPFAIPGQKTAETSQSTAQTTDKQDTTGTEEISWLYLMQHYNKENAALYKAQQEAKKAAKQAAEAEKKAKKGKKDKKDKEVTQSAINTAFAIPGQTEESKPMTGNPVMVPVQEEKATSSFPQASVTVPVQQPVTPVIPIVQTPQPMGTKANFGETTVLSSAGMGETAVLDTSVLKQEVKPYLIRSKNNEKILIDKPVFRIGKERSYVDYFIGDNSAISRSHANIINHDGEYFIMDTNSTNHTYINGGMLQSMVETKISNGTKIRLANEDFEFKFY